MASIAMLNYQVVTGTRRGGSFKKGHEYRKHFAFFGSCWWAGKIKLKWNEMKWRNERMNCMKNECKNESMEWKERMKERINPWMNELMNEWMHAWMNAPFADLIVQKCSAPLIFFYDFYVKSSCGYILVHLLPTSSSQSAPSPTVSNDFYLKSSPRYSLVHLLPTSSSKSAPRLHFFTVFTWNRALASVSCTFYWPHFPKVHDIYVKSSSCYSLVHLLRTSSSKNVPRPQFLRFLYVFYEIELSLQSRGRFWPHFPKVFRARQFFTIFMWNRALATVLCAFCRRKQSPDFGDHGRPRYPKKTQGFAPRQRVFSRLHSRVPDLLHFPTTWWWCAWHDDVVDMMVRMLPMTIVRNSEVFKLNFLWPKGKWWIMIVAV